MVGENECGFCQERDGTPRHLLVECDAVALKRTKSLGMHQVEIEDIPNLEPLQLVNFIKELGLEGVL